MRFFENRFWANRFWTNLFFRQPSATGGDGAKGFEYQERDALAAALTAAGAEQRRHQQWMSVPLLILAADDEDFPW